MYSQVLVITVASIMERLYFVSGCCTTPYCARDCGDIYDLGFVTSGVYVIYPGDIRYGIEVFCDMENDEGGWLVIQRRENGSLNFNKTFNKYQIGFGDKEGEHWLGNLNLHLITSQTYYQLRVDVEDWHGNKTYLIYRYFRIGDMSDEFFLHVASFGGNIDYVMGRHSGKQFSAWNRDNDKISKNCAAESGGGWWYTDDETVDCYKTNLNGAYKTDVTPAGITWTEDAEITYTLRKTVMNIRRW